MNCECLKNICRTAFIFSAFRRCSVARDCWVAPLRSHGGILWRAGGDVGVIKGSQPRRVVACRGVLEVLGYIGGDKHHHPRRDVCAVGHAHVGPIRAEGGGVAGDVMAWGGRFKITQKK